MVRFLGIASLVLFLQIALVSARDIARISTSRRGGTASACASGSDLCDVNNCCDSGTLCCKDGHGGCCGVGWGCAVTRGFPYCHKS